jgi:hypothetical protein
MLLAFSDRKGLRYSHTVPRDTVLFSLPFLQNKKGEEWINKIVEIL